MRIGWAGAAAADRLQAFAARALQRGVVAPAKSSLVDCRAPCKQTARKSLVENISAANRTKIAGHCALCDKAGLCRTIGIWRQKVIDFTG
jgi:hypothetical protein